MVTRVKLGVEISKKAMFVSNHENLNKRTSSFWELAEWSSREHFLRRILRESLSTAAPFFMCSIAQKFEARGNGGTSSVRVSTLVYVNKALALVLEQLLVSTDHQLSSI